MARHFTFARNGNGDCNGMNDGHGHGHGHGMGNGQADFARIGAIFNDATSLLVGGITDPAGLFRIVQQFQDPVGEAGTVGRRNQ